MKRAFVLASASPRRRQLLASVGLQPEVRPSDIDETPLPEEAPVAYALRVARGKAAACDSSLPVLAADTVVTIDGECLGKAKDRAHAIELLQKLSGRSHLVHTAVALKVSEKEQYQELVSTSVRFRELGLEEIERYIDSGEPMDKAGAYGIQGLGGALVAEVHGSYSNVVGLPLEETLKLLNRYLGE